MESTVGPEADESADGVDEEAARGRTAGRTYRSRLFPNANVASRDFGTPSRFVYKVIDDANETEFEREGEAWTLSQSPAGRVQFKVLVSRESGRVTDLWIVKVPKSGALQNLLHLRREKAISLLSLIDEVMTVDLTNPNGGSDADRPEIGFSGDPAALEWLYQVHEDELKQLIESDVYASDVVATAGRRTALEQFENLLQDDDYFNEQAIEAGGPEKVWQLFMEENPWILGVGLGTQLLTSWDPGRLEKVVAGHSVSAPGKRVDALMRTAGAINSLVFVEFKHHRTPLLEATPYRPGAWPASRELTGAQAQVRTTIQLAIRDMGEALRRADAEGFVAAEDISYLFRPRGIVVVGSLAQFVNNAGSHHVDKVRSFELLRSHDREPEIVTFDELLERARWIVSRGGSSSRAAEAEEASN